MNEPPGRGTLFKLVDEYKFRGADGEKENDNINCVQTNLTPVKRKLVASKTVRSAIAELPIFWTNPERGEGVVASPAKWQKCWRYG